MRQLWNLMVSVGLICAGLYVVYEELFVGYSGIHGSSTPIGVGLVFIGSGVVWLWFYVLGPIILKRLRRDHGGETGACGMVQSSGTAMDKQPQP
jgi:hypothetical protein